MSKVGDAVRSHHRDLMNTLAAYAEALVDDRPEADPDGLLVFLQQEVLPHATGEERHMYPALDSLIKAHGLPTATMRVDHRAIEDYTQQIESIVRALPTATNAALPTLEQRLKRVTTQLEAVVALHLYKEEETFLPLFEQHLTMGEQERVLEGMHEAYSELDVRQIPPPQRHGLIFQTFGNLDAGASFVLVNDHDPKPLYYQLNAEHLGEFNWEYEEQGPIVWRVRIGKVARLAEPIGRANS